MTFDIETTVIGAGVIGLAVARELALSGREVLILEQHDLIGSETSSRNSEVIHAGIYYEHGSMKANSCVTGRDALYAFCQSNGVPHQRIGKLIVASSAEQLEVLRTIQSKAERNGVSDLTFVDRNELKALEPALSGAGALLSPSTGIIDSHAYMLALLGNAERYGAQLVLNSPVSSIAALPGEGYIVEIGGDGSYSYTSREVIVSAGLGSTSLIASSRTAMAPHMPSTMFAKGNYFRLTGRAPFSRLVYPVPEPGGLGIHLTLDMGGQARFGPDVEWVEQPDYRVNPARVGSFYNAIRRYWPELPDDSLQPDFAGIRPKIGGPSAPNVDFLVADAARYGSPGLIGLLGMESPGLTASLAIAAHVRGVISGRGRSREGLA